MSILLSVYIFKTHVCRRVFLFDMSKKPSKASGARLDKEGRDKLDELMKLQGQVFKNCTQVFPNAVKAKQAELEAELLDTTYEKKVQYQEAEKAEKRLVKTNEFLQNYAEFEQTLMQEFDDVMTALGKYCDQVPPTPDSP